MTKTFLAWILLACASAQDTGGILCPREYVMAGDSVECTLFVKGSEGQPKAVLWSSLGVTAGDTQTIAAPSPLRSDSFVFRVTAGNISDKFELKCNIPGVVSFALYVLADPDDTLLICESPALQFSESTVCTIEPFRGGVTVYSPRAVFRMDTTMEFPLSATNVVKFGAIDPPIFGRFFNFTLTAARISSRFFITDGKTRTPIRLSVYAQPDGTTNLSCTGHEDDEILTFEAQKSVDCTIWPRVNYSRIVTFRTSFTISTTATGQIAIYPSGFLSEEFIFNYRPGSATGLYTLSLGLGTPTQFYIFDVPDSSTIGGCEDDKVAIPASLRCWISPSRNDVQIFAQKEAFSLSVTAETEGAGGFVSDIHPYHRPSQKFDFIFSAANSSAGHITISFLAGSPVIILAVIEAPQAKKSNLVCENNTIPTMSTLTCFITSLDTEGVNPDWSSFSSFVLKSTIGGSFSAVTPQVGKQFSFVFTSGTEAGQGFLSDGVGAPFYITVLGDEDQETQQRFGVLVGASVCVLVACLATGMLYRQCRKWRDRRSAAPRDEFESVLMGDDNS